MVLLNKDTTPEVHFSFRDGHLVATKVVEYCVFNQRAKARSEYCFTLDGKYTEWHQDPEHGDWPRAVERPVDRFIELAEFNPQAIPLHLILGKDRKSVERLLNEKGVKFNSSVRL